MVLEKYCIQRIHYSLAVSFEVNVYMDVDKETMEINTELKERVKNDCYFHQLGQKMIGTNKKTA